MIFRTLYSRLAVTLFVLLCAVGLILIQLLRYSSALYQEEVAQKLNRDLAEHIVAEHALLADGAVNRAVLGELFHQLMVTNPSIELYLLDPSGNILGYSAPEGKVKRDRVDLEPIKAFLSGAARFPIAADDPRDPREGKVFSAAPISNAQGLQGYLYIILGGEDYDAVLEKLGGSYILKAAMLVLLVALAAALVGGLLVFALQTRRLRLLGKVIGAYGDNYQRGRDFLPYPDNPKAEDEIESLGRRFNAMATKINRQVNELERMDSLRREMVANVSHDLRTPLTTMRGYLETLLLKESELSAAEQREHLQTALRHSRHLGKLVEELFELARLDSCESVIYSEPFSMCELVQDVTQMYRLRAQQKSIRLDAEVNREAPLVYGDIAMIQRVIENLLENGLQHTPPGGRLSVRVNVESGRVVVQVADNGHGIAADDVPRIFERFYQRQASRTDSGHAGLGLAIVKRILELHGTAIDVCSEIGRGTTFSFHLETRPAV